MKIIVFAFASFMCSLSFAQTTIEQRLQVSLNEGTLGGAFQIAIQVKGTNLPIANTLGSATIDVQFDNSQLTYVDYTIGEITFALGYSNTVPIDNTTFVRYGPLGTSVAPGEGAGYDLSSSYETLVTLNFTIDNPSGTANLTIDNGTNQIGLYESHANSNGSGIINDQTLTAPINITGEPLPVELVSFTAKVRNDNVLLNWNTATEVDNYGFDILRSSKTNKWEKIGFIEGYGNSNSPKYYSFEDENPFGGSKFRYKLKQIDTDGSFSYSSIVEVEIILDEYQLFQNYPNPFNPTTTIKFTMPEDGYVKLNVYNLLGEEVKTLINENKEAGIHRVNFNPRSLNSGVYIYNLEVNGFADIKKMIYIK
jgi:hypothetical protein